MQSPEGLEGTPFTIWEQYWTKAISIRASHKINDLKGLLLLGPPCSTKSKLDSRMTQFKDSIFCMCNKKRLEKGKL